MVVLCTGGEFWLNRLTDQTKSAGKHTGNAYDLSDHLMTLTYPNTKSAARGYDSAGRLTSVTDRLGHTTTMTLDADGNTTCATFGNAEEATNIFDAVDQMIATTVAGLTGITLASLTYTREANSQLASATSTGLTHSNETYGYRSRDQLSSVNTSSYAYDAASNPTTLSGGQHPDLRRRQPSLHCEDRRGPDQLPHQGRDSK